MLGPGGDICSCDCLPNQTQCMEAVGNIVWRNDARDGWSGHDPIRVVVIDSFADVILELQLLRNADASSSSAGCPSHT